MNLVATVQSNAIKLTWEAPINYWGSTITAYLVYRGTSASNMTQIATTIETKYLDSDTRGGVQYYYAVVASNNYGLGATTSTVEATLTTPGDEPIEDQLPIEYVEVGILGAVAAAGVAAFVWSRRRSAL